MKKCAKCTKNIHAQYILYKKYIKQLDIIRQKEYNCKWFVMHTCKIITYLALVRCKMKGYMTIAEASKKWGIGERRINTLCLEGRLDGAEKFGTTWAIPEDAEKPKDERIKTGKYIKQKENVEDDK